MTATESKFPHCNGSLERWEDPKAVLIITTLTAERDRLREALEEIAPFLCRAICPTTWKTGEARPHDELCVLVQATLKGRVNNAGTMVEASME